MPSLLRFGDWQALVYACTPDVQRHVRRFEEFCRAFLVQALKVEGDVFRLGVWGPSFRSKEDHPTWPLPYDQPWQERGWNTASFGLVIEEPDDDSYLRIYGYSLFLAAWWHAVWGELCLHSSAVARGEDGFLFLGDSEAGKTSVAQLSAAVGRSALGDDLNFVIRDGENGHLLAAAPSSSRSPTGYSTLRPRLRGIFVLVQDDSDRLVPMSSRRTARALFDALVQVPFNRRLPADAVEFAFHTIGGIARSILGYELHFRKSPDFWKLIDEQFPA